MKVAAAAYPPSPLRDWSDFAAKADAWVAEAAAGGAELLVLPEYGAMELAHLDGPDVAADLEASLHAAARHATRARDHWAGLARRHRVHILSPSGPWDAGRGRPVNRAWLLGPDGIVGHQDKQVMTRFEREAWDLVSGDPLATFRIGDLRVGVLICYDAEFPALGAASDADLLLVPSCTDGVAGFTRVRVGARARALEGQCIAVHSPTVGACPWSPAIDENRGRAAIYAPPDLGFPETGILAQGDMDAPGWTHAVVEPAALRRVRTEGHVLNRAHAREAARAAAASRDRPRHDPSG